MKLIRYKSVVKNASKTTSFVAWRIFNILDQAVQVFNQKVYRPRQVVFHLQ